MLKISSSNRPLTKATVADEDYESEISHIDVVILNEDGSWRHHERASNPGGNIIYLKEIGRSDFTPAHSKYFVYLVANSTLAEDEFKKKTDSNPTGIADLTDFRAKFQTDNYVHLTASGADGAPTHFLMDAAAYLSSTSSEPASPQAIELYDGDDGSNTELTANLKRAAAKIVVNIVKGVNVTFDNKKDAHGAGFYIKNLPTRTSLLDEVTADTPGLFTPDKNSGSRFAWDAAIITVTTYAYEYEWADAPLGEEVRLVVNVPLKEGNGALLPANYYQIPVSRAKVLNRNTCYEVTVTVNTKGSQDITEPIELKDIHYAVEPWVSVPVQVGADEVSKPKYLTVNKDTLRMYNVAVDNTSLIFASSSDISIEVVNYYYEDKFGKKIWRYQVDETKTDITQMTKYTNGKKTETNNDVYATKTQTINVGYTPSSYSGKGWTSYSDEEKDEWLRSKGVPVTEWPRIKALGNYSYVSYTVTSGVDVTATWDPGINGGINVNSSLPTNNTTRYILLKVTNGDDCTPKYIIVEQYPLINITNQQGWYSYRKDFIADGASGPTTYENRSSTNNIVSVNESYNSSTKVLSYNYYTSYSNDYRTFWRSKVAGEPNSEGKSSISFYSYNGTSQQETGNAKMYKVELMAAGKDATIIVNGTEKHYTIGRPRMTKPDSKNLVYTDPNDDNALLVSPSFMIASRLGFINSDYISFSNEDYGLTVARDHCANYVEVYRHKNAAGEYIRDEKDNTKYKTTVLDDWRLPTTAELKIIMDLQGGSTYNKLDAIDYLLNAASYCSASGPVDRGSGSGTSVRCIRDNY